MSMLLEVSTRNRSVLASPHPARFLHKVGRASLMSPFISRWFLPRPFTVLRSICPVIFFPAHNSLQWAVFRSATIFPKYNLNITWNSRTRVQYCIFLFLEARVLRFYVTIPTHALKLLGTSFTLHGTDKFSSWHHTNRSTTERSDVLFPTAPPCGNCVYCTNKELRQSNPEHAQYQQSRQRQGF